MFDFFASTELKVVYDIVPLQKNRGIHNVDIMVYKTSYPVYLNKCFRFMFKHVKVYI